MLAEAFSMVGSSAARTSIQLTAKDVSVTGRKESVFVAITDAKSLKNAPRRETRGKEPRVALAVGGIRLSLFVTNCSVRWCPQNVMVSDPLTKRLHKATSSFCSKS